MPPALRQYGSANPMGNWVRFRFRKDGDLRWIGHLDLLRALERLFRRAEVTISQTEGFHPHPRVHFPASLALGMIGRNEVLEVELPIVWPTDELLTRLNGQQVPGLTFTSAELLPGGGKRTQALRLHYEVPLPPDREADFSASVARFLALSTCVIPRNGKSLDLRPQVERLAVKSGMLTMVLRVVEQAGVKPREVLQVLGATPAEQAEWEITRSEIELNDAPRASAAESMPTPSAAATGVNPPSAPAPSETLAEHRKHTPA
jgi:radical SAM-linked protein